MAVQGGTASPELPPTLGRWRIGACVLDEQLAAVSVDGAAVELDRSSYEVLLALLRHAGEVVTKDELLEAGWPGRIVSENSLVKAVSRLRQTLGADGESIRVVHGYGYRLTSAVRHEPVAKAHVSPAPELREGDALALRPGWHLQRQLGEGSAGMIFLAESSGGAQVAVKFANGETGLRSLKREIALHRYIMASKGGLPGVAPVLAWNLMQPPCFLEMPYYAGGNLVDWAAAQGGLNALPLDERIAMCAGLCETIARLHELGVLHKDLKPANLYPVSADGDTQLVLADLGVAEATSAPQMADLGLTFSMPLAADGKPSPAGSLLYIAPEVIAGGVATQHSDVYALGVILFQLCVADLRSSLAPGWEQRIDDPLLREDIAAAAALNPERRPDAHSLSVRLRNLTARGLARAAELQQEKDLAAKTQALAMAQQRRKFWLTLSGALAVGLVAALVMWWQANAARKQAQDASSEKQAVVNFLANDLLAQADPYTSNQSDITIRSAVDNAASKVDRAFSAQPDVAVELHKVISTAYDGLSLYKQASEQLRLAMKDYARSRNPVSRGYADLAIDLCGTLQEAEDFQNATQACDEGNRLLASLGEASAIANLETGNLLSEKGRCREALDRLNDAQTEQALSSEADKRLIAREAIFSKALCLQELGQTNEARHAFLESIQNRRSEWPNSLYLAGALSDYGYFLVEQGQFTEAETMLNESHALFADRLALDDPDRYRPEYAFALMRLSNHDWTSAIKLLEPIFLAERNAWGTSHLWPLMTLSDLAWAKAEAGPRAEAAENLDTAMTLANPQLAAFGTQSTFLVDRWIRASLALGRDDLARTLIDQQQGLVGALEPHHLRTAMLPCYRAELLRHDRNSAQASIVDLEKKCRAELLVSLPADHPFVKDIDARLGSNYETRQR